MKDKNYLLTALALLCSFPCLISIGWTVEPASDLVPAKERGYLRIATYNVSLNRNAQGQLAQELSAGDEQASRVAAVIRAIQPDILLINEIDYAANVDNARLFEDQYLASTAVDRLGSAAWPMQFVYSAEVNTGVSSGLDLDNDGNTGEPEDAWGYGRFPGQYGMAVLSRFEIQTDQIRTFQRLLWARMPGALRPQESGKPAYYSDATWQELRLSSKSFWDVPIVTPLGVVHVLASHPTPPAFDGPEDRNGCRNHDEIRLIGDYIEHAAYLVDDRGVSGGLPDPSLFVVLGDLNSDPVDGGSRPEAIRRLLEHPRISRFEAPISTGAAKAAQQQGKANAGHQGDPALDTGDFSDASVGNLRVDYALPSSQFQVGATGVFWPDLSGLAPEIRESVRNCLSATDHHLVWIDVTR